MFRFRLSNRLEAGVPLLLVHCMKGKIKRKARKVRDQVPQNDIRNQECWRITTKCGPNWSSRYATNSILVLKLERNKLFRCTI